MCTKRLNQVNWGNKWDVTPKGKTKMSNPLAQNNWGNKWGCCTGRQDKGNANPPCQNKRSNKNDKQPY